MPVGWERITQQAGPGQLLHDSLNPAMVEQTQYCCLRDRNMRTFRTIVNLRDVM